MIYYRSSCDGTISNYIFFFSFLTIERMGKEENKTGKFSPIKSNIEMKRYDAKWYLKAFSLFRNRDLLFQLKTFVISYCRWNFHLLFNNRIKEIEFSEEEKNEKRKEKSYCFLSKLSFSTNLSSFLLHVIKKEESKKKVTWIIFIMNGNWVFISRKNKCDFFFMFVLFCFVLKIKLFLKVNENLIFARISSFLFFFCRSPLNFFDLFAMMKKFFIALLSLLHVGERNL